MACDTFLKVSLKCRRKFVVLQIGEQQLFVEEILHNLPEIIADLENSQIQTFYEAMGGVIHACTDAQTRVNLLNMLMAMPNQSWSEIMQKAAAMLDTLRQPEIGRQLINIMKTNIRACGAVGAAFMNQLGFLFMDMMNIYKAYSAMIMAAMQTGGPHAAASSVVRMMRGVKREILGLIEIFIEKSENSVNISNTFLPPLLETMLSDYKNNLADTRDAQVLSLLAMIINKLQGQVLKDVPRIFEHTFSCTLEMITKNFQDYPEHRLHFFNLMRAINNHAFQIFFSLSPADFKLVIDSIVWAFKHTERNISETGLNILLELLRNIGTTNPQVAALFYKTYFIALLQDIFYILTDTFHRSGFKLQATLLQHMFFLVEKNQIQAPLWDSSLHLPGVDPAAMSNSLFLRQYMTDLLANAFKNLTLNQVKSFITGLFDMVKDIGLFKSHLRDFLVQLKEFSSGDNEELFLEEREATVIAQRDADLKKQMSVPGLLPPSQQNFDDMHDE